MNDLFKNSLFVFHEKDPETFKISALMTCTENISEMFQH